MVPCRLPRAFVLALLAAAPAWAAPVSGDSATTDPYELALRWTLAVVTVPATVVPVADAPAQPRPAVPAVAMPSTAVPDPGAYALMGLGLLAAGLAARHIAARAQGRQRGLSKKTQAA